MTTIQAPDLLSSSLPKSAISLAKRIANLPAGEYVIRLTRGEKGRLVWQILQPYGEPEVSKD